MQQAFPKDWDRLNIDWIPTLHLGHSKQQTKDSEGAVARFQRAAERYKRRAEAVDKEIEENLNKLDEPGDVRIHVERVIGLLRQKYTILQRTLPIDYLTCSDETSKCPVIDKMIRVCAALTNLCPSVFPFE